MKPPECSKYEEIVIRCDNIKIDDREPENDKHSIYLEPLKGNNRLDDRKSENDEHSIYVEPQKGETPIPISLPNPAVVTRRTCRHVSIAVGCLIFCIMSISLVTIVSKLINANSGVKGNIAVDHINAAVDQNSTYRYFSEETWDSKHENTVKEKVKYVTDAVQARAISEEHAISQGHAPTKHVDSMYYTKIPAFKHVKTRKHLPTKVPQLRNNNMDTTKLEGEIPTLLRTYSQVKLISFDVFIDLVSIIQQADGGNNIWLIIGTSIRIFDMEWNLIFKWKGLKKSSIYALTQSGDSVFAVYREYIIGKYNLKGEVLHRLSRGKSKIVSISSYKHKLYTLEIEEEGLNICITPLNNIKQKLKVTLNKNFYSYLFNFASNSQIRVKPSGTYAANAQHLYIQHHNGSKLVISGKLPLNNPCFCGIDMEGNALFAALNDTALQFLVFNDRAEIIYTDTILGKSNIYKPYRCFVFEQHLWVLTFKELQMYTIGNIENYKYTPRNNISLKKKKFG